MMRTFLIQIPFLWSLIVKTKLLIISSFLIIISNITCAVRFFYLNSSTKYTAVFAVNWLEHNPVEFRTKILLPSTDQGEYYTTDPRWGDRAANARIQYSAYIIPEDGGAPVPHPSCRAIDFSTFQLPPNAIRISHVQVQILDYACMGTVGYTHTGINGLEFHTQTVKF
jgi:hypothetical protein